MRVVSRGGWSAAALVLTAVVAGCGGSVADADAPIRTRANTASSGPFCSAVQANADAIRPLNDLARTGAPARDLAMTIDAVRVTGTGLINTAPAGLGADVQRTVDSVNMQLDALIAAGGNAATAGRDPDLAARLRSPELAAASRRVGAYVTQNCGSTTGRAR